MATIPQLRDQLLAEFPEKQADLLARVVMSAHDDLVTRADLHTLTDVVKDLAEAQKRTETRVEQLTEAQKRTETRVEQLTEAQKRTETRVEQLTEAQKRTEIRVEQLTEAQKRTEIRVEQLTEAQKRTEARVGQLAEAQVNLADAQARTEVTVAELVKTQNRMLIRLDRLDGRMLESTLSRHLPAYVGRVFRKCRIIEPLDLVDSLEGRLPEADLDDLLRADIIATASLGGQSVHLVVEVSCTADSDDIERALRRAAALSAAGLQAIGIVACEAISPQTLAVAQRQRVRVLVEGRLVPEAA